MYTVIHSTDPFLLARMATDLMMEGMEKSKTNADYYHPFTSLDEETKDSCPCKYMAVYDDNVFGFYNHECYADEMICFTLTSRNYLKVLGEVLDNVKK